jgi:hypothetical protein
MCFIGDHKISTYNDLEKLKVTSRDILHIIVREEGIDITPNFSST